jgi:hypothetical protein
MLDLLLHVTRYGGKTLLVESKGNVTVQKSSSNDLPGTEAPNVVECRDVRPIGKWKDDTDGGVNIRLQTHTIPAEVQLVRCVRKGKYISIKIQTLRYVKAYEHTT